jgi:peptidoglycan/LPS O-acetylase OafA/YrhL
VARAGTTLAGFTAFVLVMVDQHYPYPWSGCVILALMFTGTLIYRAEQGQAGKWTAAAAVACVLALTTVAGIWHGAPHHDHHWQVTWATSVLLAGATFGIGLAVRRWRVPRWCAWLGMISYSVYLLHPLVFDAYRSVPVLHRKHTLPDQALFFAALLAVIIGLSAIAYYLVEKPMQGLGRRVAARFGYATGTVSGVGAADAGPPGASGPDAKTPDASAPDASGPDAGPPGSAPAAASRSASSSTAVAGGSGGSP